jgi:hypothetical protein
MPLSDDDFGFEEEKAGQNLAVLAEALYLINLLLLPGIAFVLLLGLWLKYKDSAPAASPSAPQANHLRQHDWRLSDYRTLRTHRRPWRSQLGMDLGHSHYLLHLHPLNTGAVRHVCPDQGNERTDLALSADRSGDRRLQSMKKPALQRYRLLAQMGFFALFTLTPVFDLLRYDLTEKHAYFLTYQWHLGIDDLIAGRVDARTAAVNLILYLFLPIARRWR